MTVESETAREKADERILRRVEVWIAFVALIVSGAAVGVAIFQTWMTQKTLERYRDEYVFQQQMDACAGVIVSGDTIYTRLLRFKMFGAAVAQAQSQGLLTADRLAAVREEGRERMFELTELRTVYSGHAAILALTGSTEYGDAPAELVTYLDELLTELGTTNLHDIEQNKLDRLVTLHRAVLERCRHSASRD